jgi:CelD/BcsL family acetyltransferase involved in cellulose biosynthesis
VAQAALVVEELRSFDALCALEPCWRRLWQASTRATPFQTPEWLLAWWRHFAVDELIAFAVRRGDELVALLPMLVRRTPEGGRRAELVGMGNTDYVDLLARDDDAREAGALVLRRLATCSARWDSCELQPLAPDAALLGAPVPAELVAECGAIDVCPVLALPHGVARLDETVPARYLARLHYARRRLERLGRVRIDAADEHDAPRLLSALASLHEARWSAHGEPGVLADAVTRSFHLELAPALASRGMLRLYLLSVDGRAAAGFYGFAAGGCVYYYLGGFDPAFGRYSVGALVVLHAVEEAVRAGAESFDFLRGAESYKRRWGACDRPLYRRGLRRVHGGGVKEG